MTLKKTLKELEALGDEKRRAHNAIYGAGDNQYGAKLGDIRKLAKEIKTNHELALELWATGNIDARLRGVKPDDHVLRILNEDMKVVMEATRRRLGANV